MSRTAPMTTAPGVFVNISLAFKDVVSKGTFPGVRSRISSGLRLLGQRKWEWFSQRVGSMCRDTCQEYVCPWDVSTPGTCQCSGSRSLAAVVLRDVPVTDTRTAFLFKSGSLFFKDLLSPTGSATRRARSRIKMTNLDFRLWAI